ncbi:TRAP transporter large permease [Palleronia abyssalis]|uniref:TRAP transporter large permease protein n=1 Tax=Palleronia abyssalis TaxID=1501240 RepID=A0A2R8C0T4_9RHOB|nr:TRAP transporter large permease subunit [Palleronia abyssalis]SPJ25992.1 C4-dicarboxylate TRAP transporter large permease protein DctM [Palleronia abyssalis]
MAPVTIGLLGLLALILLIAARLPIGYAMIVVGAGGIAWLNGPGILLNQLKTLAYGQFSIYDLSVVPMFILMGALATRTGLSRDLFRAANAWFGWMRGGTAMASIAACAGFGAVCGSSLATASTMGKVALPELRRFGYSPALATGSIAAGGVLGILIPPSVALVIYAIIVEANIVAMFAAALIPGLISVGMFLVTIAIYVRVFPGSGPVGGAEDRAAFWAATRGVIPTLIVFGIVIGGIYAGLYNPTPAAAIGVFAVLVFGLLRRTLGLRDLRDSVLETAATTGMIYLILLGAELLKIFMSRARVPQAAAEWAVNSGLTPMAVLLILLLALVLLGCLMDSLSMILLVLPFFWPVLSEINGGLYQGAEGSGFGMSTEDLKIWFGILALVVVELGLITPPVGMNVFVISSLARDVPMATTFRGVAPFFGAEIVRVAILLSLPALSLWLPRVIAGG